MASILYDQFSSVFVTEKQDEALPDFPFRTNNRLSDFKIETIDVEDLLAKLDKNKACGTDNVHSFVLKSCASSWAIPLAIIFRKSLDVGKVPIAWLEANITPLYKKKGNRLHSVNYRPISLTSVVCKIMEKLVKKEVMEFMKKILLFPNINMDLETKNHAQPICLNH